MSTCQTPCLGRPYLATPCHAFGTLIYNRSHFGSLEFGSKPQRASARFGIMGDEFQTRSSLAVLLLECFAKGEIPASRVQQLAAAAWEDNWGRNDPLAERLAHAEDPTVHSGNVLRNVMRAAVKSGFTQAAALLPIPSCRPSQ